MPANLPQQYKEAEKRYRSARTAEEKLAILEEMLAIMPKHKGTDKLQADLKSRISKLKKQEPKSGAKRVMAYNVKSEGAGQVVLVGLPNSGKSSLLRALTRAEPEVADYPHTTREPLAGMAVFEDIQIQLVDLPPLSDDYVEPWVFDLIRRSDLVLIVLDLTGDPLHQLEKLEELLDLKKIYLEGGLAPEAGLGRMVKRNLLAAAKCDDPRAEETLELFREMLEAHRPVVPISVTRADNLDLLPGLLFQHLEMIRVYTRVSGKPAEKKPFILPRGATVLELAEKVHRDLAGRLKYARLWSGDHADGLLVQRDYLLRDRDIVQIYT
jgi:hypothetical protein